jgi:hypothetical protein
MKYAALIVVLPLLGCAGMKSAMDTPADPANPTGPSQAEAVVTSATGIVSAVNPLVGGVLAAMAAAGFGAYKKKTSA